MAFPTTSLANNQVHKENNRSFVYDSTANVWDQLRETDTFNMKSGTIGDVVTFPEGHTIQTKHDVFLPAVGVIVSTDSTVLGINLEVMLVPKSTNNFLKVSVYISGVYNYAQASRSMKAGIQYSANSAFSSPAVFGHREWPAHYLQNTSVSGSVMTGHLSFDVVWNPPNTNAMWIRPYFGNIGANMIMFPNAGAAYEYATMSVTETQGQI